jgi:hypothetical protein
MKAKIAQTCVISNAGDQGDLTLGTREVEAHLERTDRFSDNDYVPMDIFIDPETRKEHFRYSPLPARWVEIPKATAR